MIQDEFSRIEIYEFGLYGIWTEGYRDTHKDLGEVLGVTIKIKSPFGYTSLNGDYVLMEFNDLSVSNGQKVNFALANKNKKSAERGVEALIELIGLRERKLPLRPREILKAGNRLEFVFGKFRESYSD